jgi:hypothetical protein
MLETALFGINEDMTALLMSYSAVKMVTQENWLYLFFVFLKSYDPIRTQLIK